jgi:NAD(P)H dehydrogenase (quinone)
VAGFLEQASELASLDVLSGKVGGAFASPTSVSGGHESTSMSIITNLLHLGMIVVGPPYCATAFADEAGQRHPNALDLEGARQQGRLIARTADRLIPQTAEKCRTEENRAERSSSRVPHLRRPQHEATR